LAKNDIERAIQMRAAVIEQIPVTADGAGRAQQQDGARHGCPDLRWPPAVRLMILLGGSALGWTVVILLSSLLFG